MAHHARCGGFVLAVVIARKLLLTAPLALLFVVWDAALAQDAQTSTVQSIARAWLALTDRDDAAASYETAGTKFKSTMTRDRWIETLAQERAPRGAVERRSVFKTDFVMSFPGAPEGNYAIVLFRTSFATRSDSSETVTLEREPDGNWRVVGYFIR